MRFSRTRIENMHLRQLEHVQRQIDARERDQSQTQRDKEAMDGETGECELQERVRPNPG